MMLANLFLASIANAQIAMPVPPSDSIPTPDTGIDDLQIEINEVRAQNDLPLLLVTRELSCAAQRHARDLAQNRLCNQIGSDGSTLDQRARDCGTEAHAQLVGCGFELPETAIARWMRDSVGRKALLNPDNLAIGTAHVRDKWVVVFRIESK
jgi:uncharacterized protein YkwD